MQKIITTESNVGRRLNWLDALKGFAILSVILGHVLLGYGENNAFPEYNNLILLCKQWIYTWHMPLFLVISGFSFSLSCIKNEEINFSRVSKQSIKLIFVYLVFSITLGILKTIFAQFVDNPMNIRETFISLIVPNNIMWYLWVLVLYYWIFALLYRYMRKKVIWLLLLLIISVYAQYLNNIFDLRLGLRNFFCYAIFFYFGILIQQEKIAKIIPSKFKFAICSGIFAFIVALTFFVTTYETGVNQTIVLRLILEYLSAFTITIFLFILFQLFNFDKLVASKGLKEIGKGSLVIYLSHTYFVTAIKVIVIRIGYDKPVSAILLTWLIGTLASCFVYFLLQKKQLKI